MMYRIREGVLNSQWAGECGEVRYDVEQETFMSKAKDLMKCAEANRLKNDLDDGAVIHVELDMSSDVSCLHVTEVVESLKIGSSEYDDYVCKNCATRKIDEDFPDCLWLSASEDGCARCIDGFKQGESRFVQRHGPKNQPYLCLVRYYEMNEEEGNDA